MNQFCFALAWTVTFFLAGAGLAVSDVHADPPANPTAKEPDEGQAKDTIEIPLDQIWAYNMPGTRDIRDLEPEQRPEHLQSLSIDKQRALLQKRLWIPIAVSLTEVSPSWPREGQTARPGFAVAGTGRDALEETYDVLVKGEKPHESFDPGSEITLVFFSYQMGSFVHLHNINRRGNDVELRYRIVSHTDRYLSAQLALIAMGELPLGKYSVTVVQLPTGRELFDGGFSPLEDGRALEPSEVNWGQRFVSTGFLFEVVEERVD
jgi:hypothetical protein